MESINEREEAIKQVLQLLEDFGSESKFIWFREIHRLTEIDKGLLRNILNELKKSNDITEFKSDTKRILFCLKKYFKKCKDLENLYKGKKVILKDGSKVMVFAKSTKSSERTRKRLEKQNQKRQLKTFAKSKNRIKRKNTRPHKS